MPRVDLDAAAQAYRELAAPHVPTAYSIPADVLVDDPPAVDEQLEVTVDGPPREHLPYSLPAVDSPDRIRALFAELLSYPTDDVRAALRLGADPTTPAGVPDRLQRVADATADGLAQLGWIVRRHPWLADALSWELTGLAPQAVIPLEVRDAVKATAEQQGARLAVARYSTDSPDTVDTVIGLGIVDRDAVDEHGRPLDYGTVRLLLTTVRPPPPHTPPVTAAPAAW